MPPKKRKAATGQSSGDELGKQTKAPPKKKTKAASEPKGAVQATVAAKAKKTKTKSKAKQVDEELVEAEDSDGGAGEREASREARVAISGKRKLAAAALSKLWGYTVPVEWIDDAGHVLSDEEVLGMYAELVTILISDEFFF